MVKSQDETESDISIPKRDWGEKFINGIDQPIDEEFGVECDESISSVEKKLSKSPATSTNTSTDSSSGSDTERKLSTSNLSASTNKKKNSTKKKNKSLKKKKSKESTDVTSALPPLKGGLPPIKTRPILGDLPPLKGAPKPPSQTKQQLSTIEPTKKPLERQPSQRTSNTGVKSQRSSLLGDLPPLFGVKPPTDEYSNGEDEEDRSMGDIDALLQGLDDIDEKKSTNHR